MSEYTKIDVSWGIGEHTALLQAS